MAFRTPVRVNRGNKMNARRVRVDDFTFDSAREAHRYGELRLAERAGTIRELVVHPAFKIEISDRPVCTVILDFAYFTKAGNRVYEDVKGHMTALSNLKRKMVEAAYGITVDIVR